jgi:hypothetical protein
MMGRFSEQLEKTHLPLVVYCEGESGLYSLHVDLRLGNPQK